MLEAITDFWKPNKKAPAQNQIRPEEVVVGSSIAFGFVPQSSLSGQLFKVSAINTYQFGNEALTSLQLSQADSASVASLIFAESEDEYYLAISRRISAEERAKLFEAGALGAVMENTEVSRLPCNSGLGEFKGWLVSSYKREIKGMKGRIYRGDFRKTKLPNATESQEFDYMLLVSDSNEQAIEIEKYNDGRIEIYATVYRRLSDITSISNATAVVPVLVSEQSNAAASFVASSQASPSLESKTESSKIDVPKPQPITLPELNAAQLVSPHHNAPVISSAEPLLVQAPVAPVLESKAEKPALGIEPVIVKTELKTAPLQPVTIKEEKIIQQTNQNGVEKTMSNAFAETDLKPKLTAVVSNSNQETPREVRAVAPREVNLDADSIECDLRVANKIIEEAIRNEMRLADVVRRIVELPVSNPESVQIPMTLTDEDYSLLAIRYSIPAADKNAIKRRIIEDLNDFSGKKKVA
ncbi:MAG: hypothetical protein EBR02_02360 [Alphaproteobacteria bacterium]|nr:hypothetical protein [Alphaproteobacteria bacterium]